MNKLKTYEVELRRIVVVTVEAESVAEAKDKARDEVQRVQDTYAKWMVESIEEQQ